MYDSSTTAALIAAAAALLVAYARRHWRVQDQRQSAEQRCEELHAAYLRLCDWVEREHACVVEAQRCLSQPDEASRAMGRAIIQLLAAEPVPVRYEDRSRLRADEEDDQ